MKLLTSIGKDYDEAFTRANERSFRNIEVVYQKQIPYGIFGKCYTEIGYYIRGRGKFEADYTNKKGDKSKLTTLESKCNSIKDLLFKSGFSYDFTQKVLDEYRKIVVANIAVLEKDNIEEIVLGILEEKIKKMSFAQKRTSSNFFVLNPYNINVLFSLSNIVEFSDSHIENMNVINISDDVLEISKAKNVYNTASVEAAENIINALDNRNLIVNVSGTNVYDYDVYNFLYVLKNTFDDKFNSILILPVYLNIEEVQKFERMREIIDAIVWTSAQRMESSMVSLSDKMDKPVLFLENNSTIMLLKHIDDCKYLLK